MDSKSEARKINDQITITMNAHGWEKVNVIISHEMYCELQEYLIQSPNVRYLPHPLKIITNKYYIMEDVKCNYIPLDDLEFKVDNKEIYTPYCRYNNVELLNRSYKGKIKFNVDK